ncbi:MAG: hypothetical protein HC828_13175 [Blastochloris sp.]|nr:hypothetical protein [Blastochloris sp.]
MRLLPLLFTKGCRRAENALISSSGFNGELEGAVACVVEEIDLSKSTTAYNRIKDWVTSRELSIHHKGQTPYHVDNTTHWIQCANSSTACPIFKGDTRITMCFVKELEPHEMIPKRKLIKLLESQVADFLGSIMQTELPESNDRLSLPIIVTDEKNAAAQANMDTLQAFIAEHCMPASGSVIRFSEFYERFFNSGLSDDDRCKWTKIRVGRSLPAQFPKGRTRADPNIHIGNIAWISGPAPTPSAKLVLRGEYLEAV